MSIEPCDDCGTPVMLAYACRRRRCPSCQADAKRARDRERHAQQHPPRSPVPCADCGALVPVAVRGAPPSRCRGCTANHRREASERERRAAGIMPKPKGRTHQPYPDRCRHCGAPHDGRRVYCSQRCLKAWGRERYTTPDAVAARSSRRRARVKGATAPALVSPLRVFERDGWRCGLCGGDIDPTLGHNDPGEATIDHIVPLSRGGAHSLANVQAAHRLCNTRKGAR